MPPLNAIHRGEQRTGLQFGQESLESGQAAQ
jgi:hypothetical protein